MIYGDNMSNIDVSKILPPCGSIEITDSAGSNPFEKDSWNMAEQSRIFKENPEIARYLAFMAKR
jgi:hypothetical protein